MSVPIFKIRLIEGEIQRAIGAVFHVAETNGEKELIINVSYDIGNGFHEIRNLYTIILSNRTIGSLYNTLSSNSAFESVYIGGPQDIPATLILKERDIEITGHDDIGFDWNNFFVNEDSLNSSGSSFVDSNMLSFYLTSIDPSSALHNTQRSFGKYINSQEVYDGSYLTSRMSLYDGLISVGDLSQFDIENYVQINSEIMDIESVSDGHAHVGSRKLFGTINQFHSHKDIVKFLDINRIFNSSFGESEDGIFEQFRCFAVANKKDITISDVAISATSWDGVKKSYFSMFVEIPMVESFSATVSLGGFEYFEVNAIDESNLNMPMDNSNGIVPFVDQLVSFVGGENDGQQRIIIDYSLSTNRFFLNEDLPYQAQSGDNISFHTSPSSTSYTGLVDPRPRGSGIYSEEINLSSDDSIKISSLNRSHGGDMLPGDVVYLWMRRSLSKFSGVSYESPRIDFLYGVV